MNLNGVTKTIRKQYDKLSPSERFTMLLAALARQDDSERQALLETCPRKTYRMTDPAYSNHLSAARQLADMVTFDVITQAYLMLEVEYLLETTRDFERLEGRAAEALESAAAKWAALKAFCEGEGFDFDQFMSFSIYGLNKAGAALRGQPNSSAMIFEMALRIITLTEPDPALVEVYQADCKAFWEWATGPETILF